MRAALGLNYIQVSFLFTVLEGSDIISDAIFGISGDIWSRRLLISVATITAGIGLIVMGLAPGYPLLLTGATIHGFAGRPIVCLTQASLMYAHPPQHDHMLTY